MQTINTDCSQQRNLFQATEESSPESYDKIIICYVKNVSFCSRFASKFLGFLQIRLYSCSYVIVLFLSPTEEPR